MEERGWRKEGEGEGVEERGWRREGGGGKQSKKKSKEMKSGTERGVEEWKMVS